MISRIGLISFAHMHAFSYAEALQQLPERAHIAGVYDDDALRGQDACRQLGVRFFERIEDLLAESDGVIVCSENAKHKDHVIQAAEAKKPILCEKPISISMADAQAMIDASDGAQAPLMIAFPCRYSTPAFRVRQILEQEKLGNIMALKGTNRGTMPGGWFVDPALSGGGAVIDHTVHVIDLWRWLLQRDVTSVYAEIEQRFYPELPVEDSGLLSLEFEGGIFATLDTSWSRPSQSFPTWGDVTLEIIGDLGTITLDAFKQKIEIYNNDAVKSEWAYWGDDLNLGLIKAFLKIVEAPETPPITGHDGLKAVEVALAAYRSRDEGAQVSLPLSLND